MLRSSFPLSLAVFISILAPVVTSFPSAHAGAGSSSATSEFEALEEGLAGLAVDPQRVAPVAGFVFERDGAGLSLDRGMLYACRPVAGREGFFVFEGEGRFLYRPPIAVEQEQLRRLRGAATCDEPFTRLLLFFGDHTPTQLLRAFPFAPGTVPSSVDKFVRAAVEYLPSDGMRQLLLDGTRNDYFYAHLDGEEPLCFEVDPYAAEEVSLLSDEVNFLAEWSPLTVHHRPADYPAQRQEEYEDVFRFAVPHYDLSVDIGSGLDVEVIATLTVDFLQDGVGWLRFHLDPKLDLDGARWNGGEPVAFGREEDDWSVWIAAPDSAGGAGHRLELRYHGDVIERVGDWTALRTSTGWYPRTGTRLSSTYEITYTFPATMSFVSVGERIEESTAEGRTTSRWHVDPPARNVTFSVGFLERYEVRDERIPPVAVHYSEKHHRAIGLALIEEGIASGKDMEKSVAADVANSLAFFQALFGPCAAKEIDAVEWPHSHGEAFPGLVQLSWDTFQLDDDEGSGEMFRAHEVAHQWWGTGVDFLSYHDQWLSEAMAQYCALWYLQSGLGRGEQFFERLRDWRDDIWSNRQYLVGSGQEAGPIWLGYRNESGHTEGDYDLVVYRKGAWVLHMIRNLLLDLNTMDESAFRNLMGRFYAENAGRRVATSHFIRLVEAEVGIPMDWFFEQWVFGTDLPEYVFSWKSEATEGGYQVTIRTEQHNVPEAFQTYMPILVDFGGGRQARLRVHLTGANTEIQLPVLTHDPQEIRFNDLESVLCRFEVRPWS